VAISSTGRWVATAAHDHTVRLWSMNAVDPAATSIVLAGHQGDAGPILFSPDGRQLITGSDDGTARVWDVEAADPTDAPVLLRGHCGPVAALAVTPDGRTVLTGCRRAADRTDCLVRLWDLPIKEVLEKARPVIARRMNAAEQEQVLLETAHRPDDEGHQETDLH
jgi:WD40 repeat protein